MSRHFDERDQARFAEMEAQGRELPENYLRHAVVATSQYDDGFAAMAAEILRLRAAARDAAPCWQPIETAPKDGTEILALGYLKGYPQLRAALTQWSDAPVAPHYISDGWTWMSPGYSALFQPTLWLPAPPRAGAIA